MALTAQQRTFIDTFLKGKFYSKKSDAKKVDAFEEFLRLERLTQDIIDDLQGLTPNIAAVEVRITAARTLKNAGKFKEAAAEAAEMYQMAQDVNAAVSARRDERTGLLNELNSLAANPDGALAAEITDLDAKRRVVTDALVDAVPSNDAIATAKAGILTLRAAVADVTTALQDRAADKKRLADGHAKQAAQLVTLRAQLARVTTDSEHGKMDTLATGINTDLTAMNGAVTANDPVQITAKLVDMAAMPDRLDALAAEIDAALTRVLTATLSSTGTSDEQKATLVKLGKANPEALTEATAVLGQIQGSLGDVTVDRAYLDAKALEITQAAALLETRKSEKDEAVKAATLAIAASDKRRDELNAAWAETEKLKKEFDDFGKAHAAILADESHPEHDDKVAQSAAMDAKIASNNDEYRISYGEYQTLSAEANDAVKERDAAKTKLKEAETALDARKTEERQAEGKKKLLESLSFGPLSLDNGRPVPPDIAKDLIALYGRNPGIADNACDVARSAKYPESVAATAALMCDKVADGFESDTGTRFANQGYCDTYAANIVDMSANVPPAEAAKLGDYLKAGKQFDKSSEVRALGTGSTKRRGQKRTEFVGNALLKPDGSLDFAKGDEAMQHLMFHPKVVERSTPGQVIHMHETMDFLKGSAEAKTLLSDAKAPTSDSARSLLALSSGKDPAAVDKEETRGAILNAMLTPVRQGSVGSCFATAGIVKRRTDDPLAAMQDYAKLATDGVFEPKNGDDAVPAVTNFASGDDPLVRSLEYTAATAVARGEFSEMGEGFSASVSGMVDELVTKVKSKKRADVSARLEKAIKDAVEIVYDPTVVTVDSNDGSSTHGKYQLVSTKDGAVINDLRQYQELVFDLVQGEVDKSDLKMFSNMQSIGSQILKDDFVDAVYISGSAPWDLPSGGDAKEANQVILGGDITLTPVTTRVNHETADVPARTKEVMTAVMTNFMPSDDPPNPREMRSCGTRAMHDFNVLPGHPSLAPLREGGPEALAANIDAKLVGPADKLAKAKIPTDQLAFMFEKEIAGLLKSARDADKAALDTILRTDAPTAEMTPAEFKQHMKTKTATYFADKATRDVAAWAARQSDPQTPEKIAEMTENEKQIQDRSLDTSMMNNLVKDLGAPEFVIADTNWGSTTSSTYFVIIGDPVTGEPALYVKEDPPGTLKQRSDTAEWVSTEWQDIK